MKPIIRTAIQGLIERQLRDLDEYIDLLEAAIKRKEKHLGEVMDRAAKGISEEDKSWLLGHQYGDDIGLLVESLPRLLWYGAFVSLLSYFEHEMLHLARRDQRICEKMPPGPAASQAKDLKYVSDVVKYWNKRGVVFPEKGRSWKEIRCYQEIRNQIVHEGGFQDASNRSKQVTAYVTSRLRGRKRSLTIRKAEGVKPDALVLTADVCREAVETIRKFFGELVAVLP